jgi:dihydropyrimidinase
MADFDLILRGGTVVTAAASFVGDVAIVDGTVAGLGTVPGSATRVIDATGCHVMPGGVDVHAHIEQMSGMGLMNADTFETATRSAALGGTTSVISFAAQAKGQSLRATVVDYAARARRGAMIDHAFHMTVTDLSVPEFETDLRALIAEGHRSIKVFTTYNIRLEDTEILRLMAIAREAGALVCVHAETDAMLGWAKALYLDHGLTAPRHHALSHPRLAEVEAVERMCRFAEFLDQPVMLFHISTREALAAVRAARGRGVPIWAETCPHYLLMTAAILDRDGVEGAKWMCSPPQRTADDHEALWQGLALGDLQVISSDHAPYRFDATGKLAAGPAPDFSRIANGMPGLQTRLPLLYDAMVTAGRLGPEAFVDLTATAPARIYGLAKKGAIVPGHDADIVIWDPKRSHTYGPDDLADNAGYNPWAGTRVTGLPRTVILRGSVIVEDGQIIAQPGQARWIDRPVCGVRPTGRPAPELANPELER